jgi:hypothetical protein
MWPLLRKHMSTGQERISEETRQREKGDVNLAGEEAGLHLSLGSWTSVV